MGTLHATRTARDVLGVSVSAWRTAPLSGEDHGHHPPPPQPPPSLSLLQTATKSGLKPTKSPFRVHARAEMSFTHQCTRTCAHAHTTLPPPSHVVKTPGLPTWRESEGLRLRDCWLCRHLEREMLFLQPNDVAPAQPGMRPAAGPFQRMQHRSMAGAGSGPVAVIDDVDQYNDACTKVGSNFRSAPRTPCAIICSRMLRQTEYTSPLAWQAAGKLIVAYHTAAWCGPCKMIWPHVQELAASNPDVVFLKIDVDEVKERSGTSTSTRTSTNTNNNKHNHVAVQYIHPSLCSCLPLSLSSSIPLLLSQPLTRERSRRHQTWPL